MVVSLIGTAKRLPRRLPKQLPGTNGVDNGPAPRRSLPGDDSQICVNLYE